jgi:NAD(P)-dependent dehydrogenase (short-subunit alcohol dehydrogenase family)
MKSSRNSHYTSLAIGAGALGLIVGLQQAVRFKRRISFRGKTVLITGGSRGLGLELARQFAGQDADVAICARDESELNLARADLRRFGVDVLAVQCDVTVREQVVGMIEGLTRHFGKIDVLVNNAGTIGVGPMEVMTYEDYQEAMQTHFWAPLHTTLAVLPQMKRRRSGRIVNIASIGGKISVPHLLPYSASKFALVGFSEGLRAELEKDNILVTTVCPSLMRTGSPPNAIFKGQHRKEYAWFTISDSLPLATISAKTAANRIIRACRYGEAEVMLSLPGRIAATIHGMFPGMTSELNAWVHGMLPEPGGIGTARALGRESESEITRSPLTSLTREAAQANNETR